MTNEFLQTTMGAFIRLREDGAETIPVNPLTLHGVFGELLTVRIFVEEVARGEKKKSGLTLVDGSPAELDIKDMASVEHTPNLTLAEKAQELMKVWET